jgi:hypothetical protein
MVWAALKESFDKKHNDVPSTKNKRAKRYAAWTIRSSMASGQTTQEEYANSAPTNFLRAFSLEKGQFFKKNSLRSAVIRSTL